MLKIVADDFCAFPFDEEIASLITAGKECILLVPEQLALATERHAAERFPANAPFFFEVSNFSRLADRAFRREGGISYRYADRAAEAILMWKTVDEAKPHLLKAPPRNTVDTVKEQLAALKEISAAGHNPEALRRAAARVEKQSLRGKLSDLALILELFEGTKRESFGSLSEDMDKLLSILREKPMFDQTEIFVSGFTSFTAAELSVLGELMRCGGVTVALPLPKEGENALCYEESRATRKALCDIAERVGCPSPTFCKRSASRPAALAYAGAQLFRADGGGEPLHEDSEAITLLSLPDPHAAAAHIASEIARAVREDGARYRDFTVLTRAPEKYEGVLEDALLAEEIPYFLSGSATVSRLSLPQMILAAYACLERGFARADLLSYLKCGFSAATEDEVDRFDLYTDTWQCTGKSFREDIPFDMNPDGYTERASELTEAALSHLNDIRVRVLSPLWHFQKTSAEAKTAREHAEALYRFLSELAAEKTLHRAAKHARAQGDLATAGEHTRICSVVYDLLSRIAEIMGDHRTARGHFAELLSLLFSSVPLGTLPTVQDAVTVENADTFRSVGEGTVFLLGANEGEFPAAVSFDGVFSEQEREELASAGYEMGNSPEIRASREQLSFLRGLLSPTERAIVITLQSNERGEARRPSAPYRRLTALFPKSVKAVPDIPAAYTLRAAAETVFDKKGTAEGAATAALLSASPDFSHYQTVAQAPLFDPQCSVSERTASRLFPDRMVTSQTRIEGFLNCPFAYYCERGLRLAKNERAVIRPLEVGNIIHYILERFFALLREEGKDIRAVVPAAIPSLVARAAEEYLARLCPASVRTAPRLSHLFSRVTRAAAWVVRDLCDEFAHSRFSPTFFEMSLSEEGGPGMLVFRDEDGRTVAIDGRIDRVDTYRSPDGEVFVRVVDYKTGTHTFSRDDLQKCRNLQMFVYLCAIWNTRSEEFLAKLSLSPKEKPLPAGIIYSTANPGAVSLDVPPTEAALRAELCKKNLARRGFFLAEEDIIRAMDDDLSHLPVHLSKDGSPDFSKKNTFGSLEEFGEMLDETEAAVLATARRMRSGCADISPDEDVVSCERCAYRPMCRYENFRKKAW